MTLEQASAHPELFQALNDAYKALDTERELTEHLVRGLRNVVLIKPVYETLKSFTPLWLEDAEASIERYNVARGLKKPE